MTNRPPVIHEAAIHETANTVDTCEFTVVRGGTARITTHPGEVLREEFMNPLDLSANALSRALDVPPNRITAIMAGDRAVTSDTALRLARYFGTSPEFWLNLQMAHDLSSAVADHGAEIAERVRPREAAGA